MLLLGAILQRPRPRKKVGDEAPEVRLLNGDGELGGEAGQYPEMLEHFHRRYHTTFLRYLSRTRPCTERGHQRIFTDYPHGSALSAMFQDVECVFNSVSEVGVESRTTDCSRFQ